MRVLDLFSGIGGFSLGLEAAGMTTVAFCEREPFCRAVLKKHWPDIPCHDDVTTLDGKQYNGTIDVIAGGFPCQDISLAGKGAGLAGERSSLWFEYLRIIKEAQPRYAIIENVSALRSRGLEEVLRSLAEIGYDAEWHCIPASAVGAPHRRDRVWVVAYPQGERYTCGEPANEASQEREIMGGGETQGLRIAESSNTHRVRNDALMADANDKGSQGRNGEELSERASEQPIGSSSTSIPNAESEQAGGVLSSRLSAYLSAGCDRARQAPSWEPESHVCGVADGVPNRVHRLKSLGNSIVPQIAQIIGGAILKAEGDLM
ncbi:MAG: DNA cytosine methyltransferase [Patescibacteria group bacterium]|nr:DNA cytosine methyltransferase [Patescibacteria group bacterium]